jgi:predicted metalloprotease with PDZ domain
LTHITAWSTTLKTASSRTLGLKEIVHITLDEKKEQDILCITPRLQQVILNKIIMARLFFIICVLVFTECRNANFDKCEYAYTIGLDELKDDKLSVELNFTGNLADTTIFYLPKIVPGVYDELNFGKYLSNFQAFNKYGQPLEVKKIDENSWKVIWARKLTTIRYIIDDGWEKFDFEGIRPYRSAESHFDSAVMILNTHSIFGYFDNNKNIPFRIKIKKPVELYAATGLHQIVRSRNEDEFLADNYRILADNPIMYSSPDTTSINLPNISVNVACYSSSGKKIANELANYILPLLKNQAEYLGGKFATDNYTFIIYHNQNLNNSSNFADGLEHSHSTLILIYSPFDMEIVKNIIFNLASHEFFHTLMPLGLHSHEIADFDFNHPKFSKHLWLYEGMTEYFTIHMPIRQNMQDLDEFIKVIEGKISKMKQFENAVSIIDLSLNPMEMPEEYMNVYFKGALINLCLDIQLRDLSNGIYGVQDLVAELLNKYGKDKPFEDDELFNDIIEITGHPEIGDFIDNYIAGNQELPLKENLLKVGFDLNDETGKISQTMPISEAQKFLRKQWINQ